MYLGFILISYGHAGTKMIFMKEEVYTHRSLETGAMRGHVGKHRGQSGGRGARGEHGPEHLFCSLQERVEESDKANLKKFRI